MIANNLSTDKSTNQWTKKPQELLGAFFEVTVGIEPTIRVLQTHALPLGHVTEKLGPH